MQPKIAPRTVCAFRLLTTLLAFAAGSQHGAGLKLIAQNLEIIGPRQWLELAVAGTPVIAPVSQRIAGALARRARPATSEPSSDIDTTETLAA